MSRQFVQCASSLVLALLLGAAPIPVRAQVKARSGRRVLVNIQPEYPLPMRNAHIGGVVRMIVTVSASGNVTKIELIGGNAIFAESSIKAVMKWKFSPAATETTDEIQIRFNPDSPNTR